MHKNNFNKEYILITKIAKFNRYEKYFVLKIVKKQKGT